MPAPQRSTPTVTPLAGVAEAYRTALTGGELEEFSLTGYDRTGIPVTAAVWDPTGSGPDRGPSGGGDVHGVGYGPDEPSALVGALGEMAERILLAPVVAALPRVRGSHAGLVAAHGPAGVVNPVALGLEAGSAYDAHRPLDWVPATRWRTGETVWVPVEFVASDGASLGDDTPPGGRLTTPVTNGLGAGDTVVRAVAHGLLELVQRDGDTVSFRALDQGTVVDLDAVGDPAVRRTVARLRAVGVHPVVKMASTEFACVVYAVATDDDPDTDPMALGAVGEAAHPDGVEAIGKALLELASSRARRVFAFGPTRRVAALSPHYWAREQRRPLGPQEDRALREMARWAGLDATAMRELLAPTFTRSDSLVDPAGLPSGPGLDPPAMLALMLDRLAAFDVLVVAAEGPSGMAAAKVVVPGLEVETLSYLRMGERVAARLLAREPGRPGADLVGRGAAPGPHQLAVHLTAEARERLGGPVWLDRDAVARTVGALYPLYREPRRHAVARTDDVGSTRA